MKIIWIFVPADFDAQVCVLVSSLSFPYHTHLKNTKCLYLLCYVECGKKQKINYIYTFSKENLLAMHFL